LQATPYDFREVIFIEICKKMNLIWHFISALRSMASFEVDELL
jgi:hypothetical protein